MAKAALLCTSASGSERARRKRGKSLSVKGVQAPSRPLTTSAREPMAVERSPLDRSGSCSTLQTSQYRVGGQKLLSPSTHVVRSHLTEEHGEQLSEIATEDGCEGSDQVASRTDQSGIVLGLFSRSSNLLVVFVRDLTRSLALEQLVEVLADGLNVCEIEDSRSALCAREERESKSTYIQER